MEEYIITVVKTELETQLRWERSKNEKLKQSLDVAARQVRVGESGSVSPTTLMFLPVFVHC